MQRKKSPGLVQPGIREVKAPDYVVVELRHDSQVAYSTRKFEAPSVAKQEADTLNEILDRFRMKTFASHFGLKAPQVRKRSVAAPSNLHVSVTGEFAQSGFVQLVPRVAKDCDKIVRALNRAKAVWKAYVAPRPIPAAAPTGASTTSRNFEPTQGYLHSPPNGIGAMDMWHLKGARGRGVRICDIEGNWNRKHEDLPKGIPLIGGTLIPGWMDHGTAVLGEMVSRPGTSGTVGISHRAKAVVQSAMIGGVFNAASAIINATSKLKAGDVILIELHAPGPTGKYVAMQYWPDIFSAIRSAVEKGIVVVEAAGNGNENFNLPIYNGTGLQKDSGAIVVGAGIPPTNFFDRHAFPGFPPYSKIGTPRSRIWFSNYGKIVSVQGWGWHVTTTGYGDAQGGVKNRWYTLRFSGTSSASPIVAGAVACVQGRAKAKKGKPLTPAQVRKLLIQTGTPQKFGPGVPLSQHIGPQPDLTKAIKKI